MSEENYKDTEYISNADLNNNDFSVHPITHDAIWNNEYPNDLRESRNIFLRPDAKDASTQIIGNDTQINYLSESHPNKRCIEVIEGHWDICNLIGSILTLKEQ